MSHHHCPEWRTPVSTYGSYRARLLEVSPLLGVYDGCEGLDNPLSSASKTPSMTDQERAEHLMIAWVDSLKGMTRWEPVHARDLRNRIAAALSAARLAQREQDIEILDKLPIDKARCQILLLTTQAWEEAIEACIDALRTGGNRIC